MFIVLHTAMLVEFT